MLSGTTEQITKMGAKTFISVKLLERIQGQLMDLPEKHKTQLETKEAVAFLYQDISSALAKNYTLSEISDLIKSSGWELTESSLKYFCKISRTEKEKNSKGKKSSPPKNAAKKQSEHPAKLTMTRNDGAAATSASSPGNSDGTPKDVAKKGKSPATGVNVELEAKPEAASERKGNKQYPKQKDAHFDFPPDTEDL